VNLEKVLCWRVAFVCILLSSLTAQAHSGKPHVLVIMPDDVGYWNVSACHNCMIGRRTPNIDSIAEEGALFTDAYAQQSCTAGRSAFITGQSPFRTGLLKFGLPGAKQGLQDKNPTIADLLEPMGYVTGQIGKNHLGYGDWNVHFKTVEGNLFTGQVREMSVPLAVNLRMNPFERMIEEGGGAMPAGGARSCGS